MCPLKSLKLPTCLALYFCETEQVQAICPPLSGSYQRLDGQGTVVVRCNAQDPEKYPVVSRGRILSLSSKHKLVPEGIFRTLIGATPKLD